jgi:hypothetical protein
MILRDKCPASYLLQQLRLKKCKHMLIERREQRSTFISSWAQRWRFVNEIKLSNGMLLQSQRWRFVNEIKLSNGMLLQNLLWMLKRKKKNTGTDRYIIA